MLYADIDNHNDDHNDNDNQIDINIIHDKFTFLLFNVEGFIIVLCVYI